MRTTPDWVRSIGFLEYIFQYFAVVGNALTHSLMCEISRRQCGPLVMTINNVDTKTWKNCWFARSEMAVSKLISYSCRKMRENMQNVKNNFVLLQEVESYGVLNSRMHFRVWICPINVIKSAFIEYRIYLATPCTGTPEYLISSFKVYLSWNIYYDFFRCSINLNFYHFNGNNWLFNICCCEKHLVLLVNIWGQSVYIVYVDSILTCVVCIPSRYI